MSILSGTCWFCGQSSSAPLVPVLYWELLFRESDHELTATPSPTQTDHLLPCYCRALCQPLCEQAPPTCSCRSLAG